MGAVEAPRQMVGGMSDAAQSMLHFEEVYVDSAGFMERLLPAGGIQILDKTGNFDLDYLSADEWQQAKAEGLKEGLPTVGEPASLTGDAVRSISQFMRRFG